MKFVQSCVKSERLLSVGDWCDKLLWAFAQCFTWKFKRSLSLYDLVTELTCKLTLYNALCYHGINRLNDYISQCKKLLIQIISSYFNFPMTIWSGRPVPALHMFELENPITRCVSLNDHWTHGLDVSVPATLVIITFIRCQLLKYYCKFALNCLWFKIALFYWRIFDWCGC